MDFTLLINIFSFMCLFGGLTSEVQFRTLYASTGPQGCDNYRINHVHEGKTFNIIWRKGTVPPLYCKFGFDGQGNDKNDRYKVCVEVLSLLLHDCSVSIKYYLGDSSTPNKTYGCHSNITKVCADEGQIVDIAIESSNQYHDLSGNISGITMEVTAVKTFDYKDKVMEIVTIASIVLGIILGVTILVVIGVICLATRNGKNVGKNWRKKTIKKSLHYNPTGADIPYDESPVVRRTDYIDTRRRKRRRPPSRRPRDISTIDVTLTESSEEVFPPSLRWRPDAPPCYEEAIARNMMNVGK